MAVFPDVRKLRKGKAGRGRKSQDKFIKMLKDWGGKLQEG